MADKIKADTYFVTECPVSFQQLSARGQQVTRLDCCGFTLVELMVVVAILGVLATMAIPLFNGYMKTVKNGACTADIRSIDKAIQAYVIEKNALPASLNDLGMGNPLDPWQRPFEFQVLGPGPAPAPLQDEVLGDRLNMDYDLYSKGEDGLSDPVSGTPGNADDIVRSSDGVYVGPRP